MSNNIDHFIFKRKPNEYSINLRPVNEYFKQASVYVSKEFGIPIEEAGKYVKEVLQESKTTNPIVKYRYRSENGDRIIREDKLTNYIKEVIIQ